MPTLPVVLDPPVTSVPEAVSRMRAIGRALPKRDGVACFNQLYLKVTQTVERRLGTKFFADDDFLARLDIEFANRYFDALRSHEKGESTSKCWEALIERRDDKRIHPIQFVAAGMNAHINFDLALALVSACQKLGDDIDTDDHKADFDQVNEIFRTLEAGLRREFQPASFGEAEGTFPDLDAAENAVAHFSIVHARDQAWDEAKLLDDLPRLARELVEGLLDRTVSVIGHGLLIHVTL
jgi:hypothetical protein